MKANVKVGIGISFIVILFGFILLLNQPVIGENVDKGAKIYEYTPTTDKVCYPIENTIEVCDKQCLEWDNSDCLSFEEFCWDKTIITKQCTLTLYSGTRNVFEDGEWKRLEDAKSLKDVWKIVWLENDPSFDILVFDFNYTDIELRLNFLGDPQDYPEYCPTYKGPDEFKCQFKLQYKEDGIDIKFDYKYEVKDGEIVENTNKFSYKGMPLSKKFTFGGASTTIQLQDANTENLEDATFSEEFTADGTGISIGADFIDGTGKIAFIKFNISSISPVYVSNATLCLYATEDASGASDEDLDVWRVDNQSWGEHEIDPMCSDGVACSAIFDMFTTKLTTYNGVDAVSHWDCISVTSGVYADAISGNENTSFALNHTGNTADPYVWWSKDYGSYFPYLNVTYLEAPTIIVSSPTNTTYTTASIDLNQSIDSTPSWIGYELNGATNVTIGGDIEFKTTLTDNTGEIYDIYSDSNYFYGVGSDNKVYVWNRTNLSLHTTLTDGTDNMNGIFVDSTNIYGANSDGKLYIWNISNMSLYTTLIASASTGVSAVYVDSTYIYVSFNPRYVYIWYRNNLTARTILTASGVPWPVTTIYDVYANSNFIFGSTNYDKISVWNRTNMSLHTTLTGDESSQIPSVYVDSNFVYGASRTNKLYVWYLDNFTSYLTFTTISELESVYADSRYIYGGTRNYGKVYVWLISNMSLYSVLTPSGLGSGDYMYAVHADSKYIYGGNKNTNIYVWNNWLFNVSITAQQGSNTLLVWGNDTLNNMNYTKVVFFVDSIPPSFSGHKTNTTPHEDRDVVLNATITDTNSVVDTVVLEFTNEDTTTTTNFTGVLNESDEWYIVIDQDNYTAHDNITYYWYANDTVNNLNMSYQQEFIVDNQVPTHSTPILNTTSIANVTSDNMKCWNVSTVDNDAEDTVQNIYRWYRNDSRQDSLENFTVVNSGNTSRDDVWFCEIIPFDGYGNGTSGNSTNLTIENSAPTIPVHSSPFDGFISGANSIELVWSTSTDNDTDSITYYIYINDILNTSTTGTSKTISFSEATWYWNLTADDGVDNSSRSDDWSFDVDTTYPIVYLMIPIDDYNTTTLTLDFEANYTDTAGLANATLYIWNSTGGVNSTLDNITGTSNATNITVILPGEEIYKWNYYSCDDSDKCTWNSTNFTLTIDLTAPTITFVNPTNGSYYKSGVIINVSFYDPRLNESLFSNDSWATNYTTFNISTGGWDEKEHEIHVFVNDTLNNVNTSTFNITIDDTEPTYRSITYSSSITEGETQTFTVNATDTNIDSAWIEIYNGETSARSNHSMNLISNDTYNWSGTWAVTSDKTFNFTIYINDSAENLNSSTETSFTVKMYVTPTPTPGGGGAPPVKAVAVCGNGICEVGEDIENCPEDCLPVENITIWLSPEYMTRGGVLDFSYFETIFILNPTPYNLTTLVQVQCVEDDPSCDWLYIIDDEGNLTKEIIIEANEGSEQRPGRTEINIVLITPKEMAYSEYRSNILFSVSGFKRSFSIDLSYQQGWEIFYSFLYSLSAPLPAFPQPFLGIMGIPAIFWIILILIIIIIVYVNRGEIVVRYGRYRW